MTKIDLAALREACAKLADKQEWMSDYDSFADRTLSTLLDRIEELEGALRIIDDLEDPCNEASSEQSCVAVNALTQKEPT